MTVTEKDNEAIKLVNKLFQLEHANDQHEEVLNIIKKLVGLNSLNRVFPKLIHRHPEALALYLQQVHPHKLDLSRMLLNLIPLCIERHYSSQYEAIVKKLQKIGWTKLNLCPAIMIRPYLVDSMNQELYERAMVDLRMTDDELDRVSTGEKINWYDHGSVTEVNGRDEYFGYRRAWHMFHYAPEINQEEFNKHWEENSYDCTYTAFIHFILWKQGYTPKEWEIHYDELNNKSIQEQWQLFFSLR